MDIFPTSDVTTRGAPVNPSMNLNGGLDAATNAMLEWFSPGGSGGSSSGGGGFGGGGGGGGGSGTAAEAAGAAAAAGEVSYKDSYGLGPADGQLDMGGQIPDAGGQVSPPMVLPEDLMRASGYY